MTTFGYIILLIFLIILSAFFSGAETALMSIHYVKVKYLVKKKKPGAKILSKLKKNPHQLIITLLLGNNIVNIFATAIATYLFIGWLGPSGAAISAIVMTIVILIFGEIIPKTFAVQNYEKVSLAVAAPTNILLKIFFPLVKVFSIMTSTLNKFIKPTTSHKISEEELRVILTLGRQEGVLSKDVAKIMHKVLDFEDTKVTKVMTPTEKVKFVDGNLKIEEVIDFIVKHSFSRYPVYLENKDNVIGVLDVDDVLKAIKEKKGFFLVKDLIRPVEFVLPNKELGDLLYEFEDRSVLMAIVVDGEGDVLGLVTIEDLLEEIVGDIFDKSNKKIKTN